MSDNRIKVLQFSISNSRGGRTSYQLLNWKYIDRSKFLFDFVTMEDSLDYEDELVQQGCTVHHISTYAEDDKKSFEEQFRDILNDGNYDIVHLHTARWRGLVAEKIAKECGVKRVIVHAHNAGIDVLDPKQRIEQEKLHYHIREQLNPEIATDFWACSQMAADFLFGDHIPKDKIQIMNNAIDLKKYEYNEDIRKDIRRDLGYSSSMKVIGTIGRLVYQKNQEFLFDLMNKLIHRDNRYRLLIVGEGEKKAEYKQIIKEIKLDSFIQMVGYKGNAQDYLQAMDVFCLPSRFEGFGMALIEAQANGLKCFASDRVPRETELTKEVTFLPLDIDEWEKSITEYSSGEIKRTEINISDFKFYDIYSQVTRLEQLYALKNYDDIRLVDSV